MAPFPTHIVHTVWEVEAETRNFDRENYTSWVPLVSSQENTIQCLALTFATISMASAILAIYWFVKMRRSFRHDLIMLVIQSDMFKAFWFMLYPIVTFAHGPIQDSSVFCQVNGFFLSVGIEASDISILMIAIHSALYIFKARSSGEGGLYPYRRIAYTIWATFPVAMASLAFINDSNAYTGVGTYCYTPVRPLWYRLALSWIPRYLIFITIVSIYASIYFYVRRKFSGFTKLSKDNSIGSIELEDHSDRSPRSSRLHTAPAMPALARHGLILDSRHPSLTGTESERYLALTVGSHKHLPISPQTNVHRFMWASFIARSDRTPIQTKSPPTQDPYPLTVASGAWPSYRPDNLDHVPSNSGRPPITKRSMVDIFTVLSHKSTEFEVPMPISKLRFVNSSGQNVAVGDMIHTRDNIQRQLRFLFIYPLVYLAMWIVPFVYHALQYDDRFATNLPFGLRCVTTVFLCSQAAVDSWLFSSREKPWRYIQGTNGSFLASLKFWSGWKNISENKTAHGPGRTRDEMVRDARAAYQRRDEELAERRTDASQTEQVGDGTTSEVEMAWWESMALDGTMRNSVADELSNLRDDVVTADSSSVDSEAPLNGPVMAHLQEQYIREEE